MITTLNNTSIETFETFDPILTASVKMSGDVLAIISTMELINGKWEVVVIPVSYDKDVIKYSVKGRTNGVKIVVQISTN